MTQVTKICMPARAHFDPLVAYWLLLHYGKDEFPGIEGAVLETITDPEVDSTSWDENGIIGIDIGGGQFDHHGKDATSTELVAAKLGILENPELQLLFHYVEEDDKAGLHNRFGELPAVVKALLVQKKTTREIVDLVFPLIDALQAKEKSFHVDARKEFVEKARVFKIKRNKKALRIAVVSSDQPDVARFGRLNGLGLITQRRSTGHVMISSNKAKRINLKPLIKSIREAEIQFAGKDPSAVPAHILTQERAIPQVPHWFYHEGLASIYNGTDAMQETAATPLSLQDIVSRVLVVLADDGAVEEDTEFIKKFK